MALTTIIFFILLLPQFCSSVPDPAENAEIHASGKEWLAIIGGLLFVILVVLFIVYFKKIVSWIWGPEQNGLVPEIPMQPVPDIESIIPMQTFSEFQSNIEEPEPEMDCAICLAHFTDEEMVRALPGCGHAFHTECIDGWLAGNPSCPLCRANVQL